MGKRRRRKWGIKRIVLLIILLWAVNKALNPEDGALMPPDSAEEVYFGEWTPVSAENKETTVVIDADSVRVVNGQEELCDVAYSFDERTLLITGVYRQDFGPFALFEYASEDGHDLLIGSAIQPDGGYKEIVFKKR